MYILLVDIAPLPEDSGRLARVFKETFEPAIATQPGFAQVRLLRAASATDHVLLIAFDTRDAQQHWVATDLHARVWAAMEGCFASYSVRDFNVV